MKPSTRAWIREARQAKNYSFFDLVHGYIYTRFPYFYISVGTGEHKLSKTIGPIATKMINLLAPHKNGKDAPNLPAGVTEAGLAFANTYHGKVVPLDAAKQLVSIKQEIRITELEKIIPYTRARDIIMHNPDHIVALDCPCRSAREHPCLPLDVCLIIGEPFASFVVEHHPKKTRWITSEEAAGILKAENERGHVHHAFFKDAELGRFYAICNCCDCCCGAMQAQRSGTPMLISSGYRAEVDTGKCFGCGTCATFCQFHAIHVGAAGHSEIDSAKCMGCGICVNHCEHKALSLVRDPSKGEPLEIQKLMEINVT
jgi:Pyruvate/2-oxoacid:ferredoxin oxidoreductase delta subunit